MDVAFQRPRSAQSSPAHRSTSTGSNGHFKKHQPPRPLGSASRQRPPPRTWSLSWTPLYLLMTDDDCVSVDVLIQSMTSGEVPVGYMVADSGALVLDNESEVFERDDVDGEERLAEPEQVEVEERGRGKRQRVANTLYGSFEGH
ncbi:hypothetical protein FIBSPDRAFT_932820 [Athelia psychrophila]|uniref:Uncharacterized protein n=1 Tax=Athelia psychrophila TaxID=1759441 RepID=A0A166I455_9AGAM|nr:hypothetical protein FIBSPDRAFT_932820 [Fibularhizoctonia sp. CBS 109695]